MKQIKIIITILFILLTTSCKKNIKEYSDSGQINYNQYNEIQIPTTSPRGLAYDGKFLWYSDDSLNSFFKISDKGEIFETIRMPDCRLCGFEFYENYIYCYNDTIVDFNPTDTSLYCCIYKLSKTGLKVDTFLLSYKNAPYLEYMGITIRDSIIYGTRRAGFNSNIFKVDMKTKTVSRLAWGYYTALTLYKETIFSLESEYENIIAPLDTNYYPILDNALQLDYSPTDMVFVNDSLWVCDRENRKLIKIKQNF